jgi:hypothetical protein
MRWIQILIESIRFFGSDRILPPLKFPNILLDPACFLKILDGIRKVLSEATTEKSTQSYTF